MSIEIRPLAPDDVHRNRVLMNHAFGRGAVVRPPNPDEPPPQPGSGQWGLFESGDLRASLTVVPFLVHWGAAVTLPMGGIAGVATFAEARGRGFVDQLLRKSLEAMRADGQVISSLFPFSWAFYRRSGWDWVGRKMSVRLPLNELRSSPEGRAVVAIPAEQARERLEPAYTRFARRYHGPFTAETHKWDGKLGHHDDRTTHVYVHEPSGAYLLWRYNKDNSEGRVHEFVADSPDAYKGFLSLLHYMATQCDHARLTLPEDSPLWSYVMHWNLETRLEPVTQARVVDFAPAMERLEVGPEVPNGAATVALRDDLAPWNSGVWRVTVEGGRVHCSLAVGGSDAAMTLDIQALSQAYWGTPSLQALRDAGRVEGGDEAAFAWLARVLPSAAVYMLDDF
jgi:predicted acetyltransferase